MQRSNSWLSALATAVGRAIGLVESGPILPVTTPPSSRGSINGEPACPGKGAGAHAAAGGEPVGFSDISGSRLPADKWAAIAETGTAVATVWLDVAKQYPFHANPITGAAQGAY